MWWKDRIFLGDNSGNIFIWDWILSWGGNFWWFRIPFFLVICISGVILAPVTDIRETSVGIWDTKNISCIYYGSNWIIIVDIFVSLCVLVDYLVVLSIFALGATKSSFDFYILSLGPTKSLGASLSSKSSVAWYFITGALGWNSICYLIFPLPIRTTNILYLSISWPSIFIW